MAPGMAVVQHAQEPEPLPLPVWLDELCDACHALLNHGSVDEEREARDRIRQALRIAGKWES